MALVTITFDGGNVPVVTGEEPASETTPIQDPISAGGVSNVPFMFAAGLFTFSLDTSIAFKPLWQTAQTIDGIPLTLTFEKVV
jgi:hypothetical protein